MFHVVTRLIVMAVVVFLLSPAAFSQNQAGLDHFLIYRLSTPIDVRHLDDVRVEHGPDIGGPKYVLDLLDLRAFANPVVKTLVDTPEGRLIDENHHLALYDFQGATAPGATVTFTNQFGPQQWVLGDPVRLFVPAKKNDHPKPDRLDHFLAYEVVEVVRPVAGGVRRNKYQLVDQWQKPVVQIRQPVMFCLPVKKQYRDFESPLNPQTIALAVYYIQPRPLLAKDANIEDQFGPKSIGTTRTVQLAVPTPELTVEWQK